jgi:hypothetical protein
VSGLQVHHRKMSRPLVSEGLLRGRKAWLVKIELSVNDLYLLRSIKIFCKVVMTHHSIANRQRRRSPIHHLDIVPKLELGKYVSFSKSSATYLLLSNLGKRRCLRSSSSAGNRSIIPQLRPALIIQRRPTECRVYKFCTDRTAPRSLRSLTLSDLPIDTTWLN